MRNAYSSMRAACDHSAPAASQREDGAPAGSLRGATGREMGAPRRTAGGGGPCGDGAREGAAPRIWPLGPRGRLTESESFPLMASTNVLRGGDGARRGGAGRYGAGRNGARGA